jgi:hypothetical protein
MLYQMLLVIDHRQKQALLDEDKSSMGQRQCNSGTPSAAAPADTCVASAHATTALKDVVWMAGRRVISGFLQEQPSITQQELSFVPMLLQGRLCLSLCMGEVHLSVAGADSAGCSLSNWACGNQASSS